MPSIKDKPLTAKQADFIERYCNPKSETYNNAYQSATKAGYCRNTAVKATVQIVENSRVKAGIEAYKAKTVVKLEHNRQIAIDKLNADYDRLEAKAIEGNIQAITARSAITRELNAISWLHTSKIETTDSAEPVLSETEREAIADLARSYAQSLTKTVKIA